MNFLISSVLISTISFFLTFYFVRTYLEFAKKYNLFSDHNNLNVPNKIVPTSAGVAISISFFLVLILINYLFALPSSYLLAIYIGVGLMTLLGFLDDLKNLSATLKIFVQILFVTLILNIFEYRNIFFDINQQLNIFELIAYSIFLIWIINTFNFIDGADGLLASNCSLLSLILSFIFYISGNISLTILTLALSFSSFGFLKLNWAPAKIFMGDSGSLFFGSIFVVIMNGSINQEIISIWTWLILLSIFYIETTVTLIVRIFRKENFFSSRHELHAYQRLVIRTKDHSSPSKAFIAIQCFWTIPASLLSFVYPEYSSYIYLFTILPMIFIFYYFGPRLVR